MLSTAELLDALRRYPLLTAAQLEELDREPSELIGESAVLAARLVERGWLTKYQVDRLLPGRGATLVLGPYIVLDRLGEGGMGAVYKARHHENGQIVALKVMGKDWVNNPDALRRFRREVRASSQLNHPNVVRALDAAEIDGTHFLAMEFVDGTDLEQLVRNQGPLPVAAACSYVRQAAMGLAHAHAHGMVHRDIKPANLLLTADCCTVKVLDLGLARLGATPGSAESLGMLTEAGSMMGTPDFLAPEQASDAHAADGRADQYSLGCTLYYLLAGRVPFQAKNITQKLLMHRSEQPFPLELIRSDVPAEVTEVVNRAMAKDPADRYPNAAAMAEALTGPAAGPNSVPVIRMMPLTESQPAESLPGASVLLGESIRRQRSSGASSGMWIWIVACCVGGLLALGIVAIVVVLSFRP